jgi:predicted ATPase/DNA-binding XRE family transcriptional regulator
MAEPQEKLSFGQWLKQRRKALDLTQEGLAERIGCSYIAVHKIEAGTRRPSRQLAELLADLFQVPAEEREAFIAFARGLDHEATPSGALPRERPSGNLPAQLFRLIGREEVATEIGSRLQGDEVRLLTLIGPPGIGKTSLGIHLAATLGPHSRDGIFFVALAPITDPALVTPTIAKVFALADSVQRTPEEALAEYLHDKQMLLVLDNFEHVVEAAPTVVSILEACPDVKVLATSREPLHVRGEHVFRVPPLQLPDLAHLAHVEVEAILGSPAVALFVERAQAIEPDFALTEHNAQTVAAICVGLEGLPLAIELAAARVRTLTPQEIRSHLESRLQLLSGGPRDLPARQQTLRSAIDWSYNLLKEGEQRLFARLGVFVGGCTLAAVEAVCNATGDISMGVPAGLASLVDKSLVQHREDTPGESRFAMLEMIREYAAERLVASGEAEEIKRLHAEYHLAFAEAAASQIESPEQANWLGRLERDLDNMRAGLAWSLESDRVEVGAQFAYALQRFWLARGHTHEGLRWIEAILSRAEEPSIPRGLLIKLLNYAGNLARLRSDFVRAQQWIEVGLKVAREEADAKSIATSLNLLGALRTYVGDRSRGKALYEEALSLRRELGDKEGMAATLNNLAGLAVHEGDLEEARLLYQEAISLGRELGDKWLVATVLGNLAHAVRRQGDYARAKALCYESLALYEEIEVSNVEATYICLADIARCQHEYAQALELYRKSLIESEKSSYQYMMGLNVLGLACLATQEGLSESAATLFGFLDALVEKEGGALILPVDKPEYEAHLVAATTSIDEASWNLAWSKGRAMSIEQAVSFILNPSSFDVAGPEEHDLCASDP